MFNKLSQSRFSAAHVAAFAAGFLLMPLAVAATTPVLADAFAAAPALTIEPLAAATTQTFLTSPAIADSATQNAQAGAVTLRYFNLDGGFGNSSSGSANHSGRDGSHGQSQDHHFEREGGTQVSSVPLPAGLLLFGSGLIGLLGAVRLRSFKR
jgi:hypothetical protein